MLKCVKLNRRKEKGLPAFDIRAGTETFVETTILYVCRNGGKYVSTGLYECLKIREKRISCMCQ